LTRQRVCSYGGGGGGEVIDQLLDQEIGCVMQYVEQRFVKKTKIRIVCRNNTLECFS